MKPLANQVTNESQISSLMEDRPRAIRIKDNMWWRETVCYQMTNGKWMITHAHSSVPFNVKSGKTFLDLKPIST